MVLEDELGGKFVVSQQAIANLLELFVYPNGELECVILNSCYSISQGKLLSLGVPYTIAMEGSISDAAAIEFSRSFYDAISNNRDIEYAYKIGCNIDLAAPGQKFQSVLLKKGESYVSPDFDKVSSLGGRGNKVEDIKALIGMAIDLSGSMAQNIRNNSGNKLSRLDGFRNSLSKIIDDARASIRQRDVKDIKTSIEFFVYGFGLRINPSVCDLLSLIKLGQDIITPEEIESIKKRYTDELQDKYRGYSGLGELARGWGLGGLVSEAESVLRANAESEIRSKVMLELKRRIEPSLASMADTTLPLEEVAKLWDKSGETLGNADEIIFWNTPMREACEKIKTRFEKELRIRSKEIAPVLFILSDGEPTDGDPLPSIEAIKKIGVTVLSCFVTDEDIAKPKVMFGKPEESWNKGAKLMFDVASEAKEDLDSIKFLMEKGWTIHPNAKLFVQVNHSDILEEFTRTVLNPLEEKRLKNQLPRGI